MSNITNNGGDFLFYASEDGSTSINVLVENETIWVTQIGMAEIFDVDDSGVSKHLKNIYDSNELDKNSTLAKIAIVQKEGNRDVTRNVVHYNLDAIIAVGYRVNSYKATQFRIWATNVLKEYLIKGFALDDDRLKQGKTLFGKDYFDELLDRIREIRASERRLYLKITDIYQEASYDYDPKSPITIKFYANVQNKLLFAVSGQTAAEIKKLRADYNLPNMGLNTWANQKKGGKVTKADAKTAKNYLTKNELDDLNRLVNMFLDHAENIAKRQNKMSMQDWVGKLNAFIQFNEYEILSDYGKVSKEVRDVWVIEQYDKYRPIQLVNYKSDFDRVVGDIKSTGQLPRPKTSNKEKIMSDFNKSLKTALDYNPKD